MKSHAVTMFEVGKLTDESLDSFLGELEKASPKILIIAIIFLLFIGIDKIFWSRKRGGA